MSKRFGFWPHITHVIVLTFKEIKHLSDYRTLGLSDYRSDPDFKLENVLVSLHSLKTMGLGSIFFKEWRVTWTFSYTNILESY